MKKIILLMCLLAVTDVANAKTEHYASIKAGFGNTTIYVDKNTKLGDWLVQESGSAGYSYDSSGLLWDLSSAIGIDWTPGDTYGVKSPYDWFHMRLEGEIGYNRYVENGKLKYGYAITDKTSIRFDKLFIMANGYMDFRIDKVSPYFGLGIGYGLGKEDITISNTAGEFNDSANNTGIIYALSLGVAYKYSNITTLDFGLRRIYVPMEDDGRYVYDTIRFGTRFRI